VESFELQSRIDAPVERVWALVSDHVGWQEWSGAQEVVLRQQGDPAPNGLGAIRVLRRGGLALEEEVTGFDPPRRLEYRVCAGIPVRECRSELRLEPSGAATRLSWAVQFRPLVPGTGWLLTRLIRPRLAGALDGLAQQLSASAG
jgi:uncharacterized protein YndB with AHSA1/START domain